MKKRNIIILLIVIVIIGIQFFQIDKMNPELDPTDDFIKIEQPPEEIAALFKQACYDCHSHETIYPWYTNVAPFSWVIGKHIQEGRDNLNFSTWGSYKQDKRTHKLEETAEEVEEKHMPIANYTWLHPEAKLSDEDRKMLVDWIQSKM